MTEKRTSPHSEYCYVGKVMTIKVLVRFFHLSEDLDGRWLHQTLGSFGTVFTCCSVFFGY